MNIPVPLLGKERLGEVSRSRQPPVSKSYPDSGVVFDIWPNLTACGTSPYEGEVYGHSGPSPCQGEAR